MAVALIGQGLVLARRLNTKHAVKQVDRMLTNAAIDVDALLGYGFQRKAAPVPI